MRIRNRCRHPIEIIFTDPPSEIDCPVCGSSSRLVAEIAGKPDGDSDLAKDVSYKNAFQNRVAHFTLIDELDVGAFGGVNKPRDTDPGNRREPV